jgi:zinc protease
MLDRSTPPIAAALEEGHDILQATTVYLDNGIPLHLILSGSQPLIRLEIVFDAGIWYEQKNNTSYITAKMLSSGTKKYSAEQIEKTIAFYGAFIDLDNGPDRSILTIYCVSKHLESLLPLIFDLITQSHLPQEEFNNLKNITLQNLKVNLAKTSYLASVGFRKNIFGPFHPYGRSLEEEAILKIGLEDIRAFYQNFFTYKNCHFIISGNGSIDFYKIFNKYFGNHAWGNEQRVSNKFAPYPKQGRDTIQKDNSLQTSLRIGRLLFTLSHKDYFNTYILTEVLGGYFGSRLMKNIREEKGYTYGIHANLVCHQNEGYLVIGTDVNKENTENTIDEIYKEIERLKAEPVPYDELDTVKNYMLGSFFNSINTPFALADKFKMIYFNGLNYSFYKQYIESIQNISAEDIREMANRYLNKEDMAEVVAGGE